MSNGTRTPGRVIFFDVDGTLGEVAGPGQLVPYRPSTEELLSAVGKMDVKLGVIMNLDDTVSDEQGRAMVVQAVLSEDPSTGAKTTIGSFIPGENVITNRQATAALGRPANLPFRDIFEFAAETLGAKPSECLFVAANLNAVLGATLAGMEAKRKECPPGRDFAPALVGRIDGSPVDSGRQFQALLEHEHLLGERIFACGTAIAAAIGKLFEGAGEPPLDQGRWISPAPVAVPEKLRRAMQYFVHLINYFADQVHLRAEEAMIDVAVACGMDRKHGEWVLSQHDQARAYWACLTVAWKRIVDGDDDDRWYALKDFKNTMEAFVYLFSAHAIREDFQLYTEAGNDFTDADDALVLNIIQHNGPSDITPYIGMVGRMEALLGIPSPP